MEMRKAAPFQSRPSRGLRKYLQSGGGGLIFVYLCDDCESVGNVEMPMIIMIHVAMFLRLRQIMSHVACFSAG